MSTVLITGANRGIGLALSRQYLENGDRVYACCRNPESASDLNTLASQHIDNLSVHQMDVANADSITSCASSLKGEAIDILINNAGVLGGDHQAFNDANLEDWLMTMQINTIGPFRVAEAFQAHLKSADNPKMMTISSQVAASTFSMPVYSYSSSKAAVNKVMQILAVEWQQAQIVVGLIHPGWVKTDMGGTEAQITTQESATGIRQVIAKITMADTGKFFKWNGEIHPW